MIFFYPEKCCFMDDAIIDIPESAIPESRWSMTHDALLQSIAIGGRLYALDDGSPSIMMPSAPVLTRDDINLLRLRAYAHPITGSDRYFSEAARLTAMSAPAEEISNATAAGIARAAEIATMYPWPEDGDTA